MFTSLYICKNVGRSINLKGYVCIKVRACVVLHYHYHSIFNIQYIYRSAVKHHNYYSTGWKFEHKISHGLQCSSICPLQAFVNNRYSVYSNVHYIIE